MKISKNVNGTVLTLEVEGRLDTMTAPELEEVLKTVNGIPELIFDFARLQYVSSEW